jgi:hypothetical protein
VQIRCRVERRWRMVHQGMIKPLWDEHALFSMSFPWDIGTRAPNRVRIEVWGYGGTGYRFLDIVCGRRRYVPVAVARTRGRVTDPRHLLADDDRWSYLGEPDVFRTFHSKRLREQIHSVDLIVESD